jgi:hypothetical protein
MVEIMKKAFLQVKGKAQEFLRSNEDGGRSLIPSSILDPSLSPLTFHLSPRIMGAKQQLAFLPTAC